LIKKDPERFIFFGERPRYAEQNLGWIQVGRVLERRLDIPIRCFRGWHYRPPLRVCQRMFVSKKWIWNPGYWVTTPNFVLAQFQRHQPKMYQQLLLIGRSLGTSCEGRVLQRVYPRLPKIHFDNAVLEKIKPSQAVVLQLDMGWSDPGTLYAIKEALQSRVGANVTRGAVVDFGSSDCLLFNDAPEKLLATVGLHGMIVVAVGDAILVVHKDHVPEVKKMVESLEGTEWSHLL
jgi:mannose-1-phosphate guanylyltransferase